MNVERLYPAWFVLCASAGAASGGVTGHGAVRGLTTGMLTAALPLSAPRMRSDMSLYTSGREKHGFYCSGPLFCPEHIVFFCSFLYAYRRSRLDETPGPVKSNLDMQTGPG